VTVGQAIVDVLRGEGVDHVYGLPGGHVLSIYDALYGEPSIRHVLVRHEQVAASMAAAHAQLTGEPGICLVTAGPGATNLLTAVAEAFVGCLPMVILAGRGSTATAQRGASQEVATDQIFAPVTKWAVRVDRPDLAVDVLRQAFVKARSGRPGPVLVDLPRDILDSEVEPGAYLPVGSPSGPRAAAAHHRRWGRGRSGGSSGGSRAGRAARGASAHQPGRPGQHSRRSSALGGRARRPSHPSVEAAAR
jgi:acetolactate synthase-1/2/3 large subunit